MWVCAWRVRGQLAACGGWLIGGLRCGTAAGRLYSFGYGEFGQLGHGDEEDVLAPKLVEALQGEQVVGAAARSYHSLVWTGSCHVLVPRCQISRAAAAENPSILLELLWFAPSPSHSQARTHFMLSED